MRNSDRLGGIIFLLLAVGAWWWGRDLSDLAGVFPRTISVILGLSSLALLAGSFRRETPVERITEAPYVLLTMAAIVVYIITIPYLGFLLSSFLFTLFISWALSQDRRRRSSLYLAIVFSLVVSLGFYSVFNYMLAVPLPKGIIF